MKTYKTTETQIKDVAEALNQALTIITENKIAVDKWRIDRIQKGAEALNAIHNGE